MKNLLRMDWYKISEELPEVDKLVILNTDDSYHLAYLVKVTPEARRFYKDDYVWKLQDTNKFLSIRLYDKWKYVDYERV